MSIEMVRLSVPAKVEYFVTVRLVVGAVFGQAGFDMEQIEDAKTAVSEACLLLMPAANGAAAEIGLDIWAGEDGVHTKVKTTGPKPAGKELPEKEISMFLLEAMTDSMEYAETGDGERSYDLFIARLP